MSMLKGKTLIGSISDNEVGCLQKPNAKCLSRCLPSQPRPGLCSTHSTLVPSVFLQQPLLLLAPLLPFTAGPAPSLPPKPSSGRPALAPYQKAAHSAAGLPCLRTVSSTAMITSWKHSCYVFTWLCLISASQLQTP